MNQGQVPPTTNLKEKAVRRSTFPQTFPAELILAQKNGFLDYCEFEKGYSKETIRKYDDCLRCFVRTVGDIPIAQLQVDHFIQLRKKLQHRNLSDSRIAGVVFAMKSFLRYCHDVLEMPCLSADKIRSPRRKKREVVYLTNDEIQQFINTIKLYNHWAGKTKQKNVNIRGLRLRTLVEVLLGSGMRLSEALSLNIEDINFEEREAIIIGKGDKQRSVFFSSRAIWWIKKYLAARTDNCEALLVTHPGHTRLKRNDLWRYFKRCNEISGLKKKVTPHILRHTFATNMLYNGCDLVTIKELLGHHDISVTARAYIGIDKRQMKVNHQKYLDYNLSSS